MAKTLHKSDEPTRRPRANERRVKSDLKRFIDEELQEAEYGANRRASNSGPYGINGK